MDSENRDERGEPMMEKRNVATSRRSRSDEEYDDPRADAALFGGMEPEKRASVVSDEARRRDEEADEDTLG